MKRTQDDLHAESKRYCIATDFEIAPQQRELRRAGRRIHIQPKPFDLLLYLLRHRDRVVPRRELLAALWPDVVVTDEALTYALHAARRALGDNGVRQRAIQTIPRCGLRFVAQVQEWHQKGDAHRRLIKTGPMPRVARQRARFVGRASILSRLEPVLNEAAIGHGQIVLLGGEAGIGKTRTADELAEIAKRKQFRVLIGRCIEVEGSPAFWPWIQIIRSFAQEALATSLLEKLTDGTLEIARMVPELRAQLPNLPAASAVDPNAARFLLFDASTKFLLRAAEEHPLLVLLDDLHRADASSLLLLEFLAREIGKSSILVIGTYRETELREDLVRRAHVASIERQEIATVLELKGLAPAEVAELITDATGREPCSEALQHLCELTEGNPFFLKQALRALDSDNKLDYLQSRGCISLNLPRRVQDLIVQQLESLPINCKNALEVGAALGRDFDLSALQFVIDREGNEAIQALSPALGSGVIREHEKLAGVYRFSHLLVRDALYQSLASARRVQLHARIGRALEKLWGGDSGSHCAALAHHFLQAMPIGEGERAILYSTKAGEWSSERAAFEEACRHYQRALEALQLSAPRDDNRRCELLLALGEAQVKSGDRSHAKQTLEAAGRIAKRVGLVDKLGAAALRFAPDFLAIETGVYDPALVTLLEEALAALDDSDSALRARLLIRLSIALHWADNRKEERDEFCEKAMAIAERLGEPETLAYVRSGKKLALYSVARPEDYLDADPGGPLGSGDEPIALVLQLLRMTSLLILGRMFEFDAEIETFTALAKKLKQPQCLWYVSLLRSMRSQMEGRYIEAEIWSNEALQSGQRVNDQNSLHSYMVRAVISSIDVGEPEQFLAATQQMVEKFPRVIAWRAGLAMIYAEMGMASEVEEQVQWLLKANVLARPERVEWFGSIGSLVLAADFLHRDSLCDKLYSLLAPHANHFAVIGYCSFCWGSVQHWLGILSKVLGRREEAECHFELAISFNRRVSARPWLARAQYDYARMLLSENLTDKKGQMHLRESRVLAEALGMRRLMKKIERETRKISAVE